MQVRFLVMGSVFSGAACTINRRYDLKGSTKGRTAGPAARMVRAACRLCAHVQGVPSGAC
jgi:hypothetical protein